MEAFVRDVDPDALFHLASPTGGTPEEGWQVHVHWTNELAWITRLLGVRMVFTSTALVFSGTAKGPFKLDAHPDATEGYGQNKHEAEQRLFQQNPDAVAVRLGWQIGRGIGGNDMLTQLRRQALSEDNTIRASTRWFPACSFLVDTAETLYQLAASDARGLYQLDSNAADRWSFYRLVSALNEGLGAGWTVEADDDGHAQDQRLLDDRLVVPILSQRLQDARSEVASFSL